MIDNIIKLKFYLICPEVERSLIISKQFYFNITNDFMLDTFTQTPKHTHTYILCFIRMAGLLSEIGNF